MLTTHLPDHRSRSDVELLDLLRAGDTLALAEAYRRTADAGHACARRLLASPTEIEALLRAVYADLWRNPPVDTGLQAWVRRRCFALGIAHLQETHRSPVSPSLAAQVSDDELDTAAAPDSVERVLGALDPADRRALVAAHDQGQAASAAEPGVGAALVRALLALADGDNAGAGTVDAGASTVDSALLADAALGLLPPAQAADVAEAIARDPAGASLLRVLRRGRRRLEGLPPTADMGQRVLAAALADTVQPPAAAGDQIIPGSEAVVAASSEEEPAVVAASSEEERAGDVMEPPGPADSATPADEPGDFNGDRDEPEPAQTTVHPAETPPPASGWTGEEPSSFFGDTVDPYTLGGDGREGAPVRIDNRADDDLVVEADAGESRGIGSRIALWIGVVVLLALGVVVGMQLGEVWLN